MAISSVSVRNLVLCSSVEIVPVDVCFYIRGIVDDFAFCVYDTKGFVALFKSEADASKLICRLVSDDLFSPAS